MSGLASESPLVQYWNKASAWIDAREYKERLAGAVIGVVLLTFLWFQMVSAPMLEKQRASVAGSKSLEGELVALDLRKAEISQQLEQDPNLRLREQIERLAGLDASLNAQVKKLAANWVPPAEMSAALRQILAGRGNLKLLSLTSDVPEAVLTGEGGGASSDAVPSVYLHGMELRLQGTYFDVLGYLEAVESVPWNFRWTVLSYEVQEYPEANVVLRLQTYGPERAWIGV